MGLGGLGRIGALAVGLIVSTTLCQAAYAADIVEEPILYDWTGFYVGGHVGWGWIDVKGNYSEDDEFDLEDDDVLFGGQIGFNYQFDSIVLGIEGDFSFVSWEDELITPDDELVTFDTDYLASVRARLGYALDNVLLYATAGGAWTDTKYYVNDHIDDTSGTEKGSKGLSDIGFVFGGGAAWGFDENWSVRAEALYYIFDNEEDTSDLTHDSSDDDFVELDDIFVARVGLDFHF